MKEIVFILSSLNDPHYRKRVEEFMDHGYEVIVYGFKREGRELPPSRYDPTVLGEIQNRSFSSRIGILNSGIRSILAQCRGKICFYSSLDIAIFASLYIRAPYIYEVCDLTELTIGNKAVKGILTALNRRYIRKSITTIITSEGFAQHFAGIDQGKFSLIPNKVSPDIPAFSAERKTIDKDVIRIGFAGVIRFETIYNFVKSASEFGHNIELHLFGIYNDTDKWSVKIRELEKESDNVIYHGPFSNPDGLPAIYSGIDMVLCTYSPTFGVKYAEPNKLYEAIYFRCPIIVSENVFLGDKVKRLNVGYVINAMDEDVIKSFLSGLNETEYNQKVIACESIPQRDCLNINDDFFSGLETKTKDLW